MHKTLTKLSNAHHVTIVALGDSITAETFHTRGRMNWVSLLREAIFERYGSGVCAMINSGRCGSTCEEALTRLDRDVLRFNPDLTILSFGMNDATRGPAYLDGFRAHARECVTRIREECKSEILIRTPNPVVTVHGLPHPPEQPLPGRPWEAESRPLAQYAAALVELAEDLDCKIVDHHTLWAEDTFEPHHPVADPNDLWLRMSDAIHPGPLGHLIFHRQLAPHFKVSPHFPWEGR